MFEISDTDWADAEEEEGGGEEEVEVLGGEVLGLLVLRFAEEESLEFSVCDFKVATAEKVGLIVHLASGDEKVEGYQELTFE